MQRILKIVVLTAISFLPILGFAQAGSSRDFQQDERQLDSLQWQLRHDRERLAFDRRHHAGRTRIHQDEDQVRRDKDAINSLRADMRRDRKLRHRRYPS
ncbi:MAG TPA: hypothetical protein VHN74_00430 [Candidatus Angelobacter sp.]|jgi:hypothetical protein|nr:hypothetical protein [Candidatus Angelobacter sp.]